MIHADESPLLSVTVRRFLLDRIEATVYSWTVYGDPMNVGMHAHFAAFPYLDVTKISIRQPCWISPYLVVTCFLTGFAGLMCSCLHVMNFTAMTILNGEANSMIMSHLMIFMGSLGPGTRTVKQCQEPRNIYQLSFQGCYCILQVLNCIIQWQQDIQWYSWPTMRPLMSVSHCNARQRSVLSSASTCQLFPHISAIAPTI